jgi:hypothetical protein
LERYDPFQTAVEIREQLASGKRKLGFLFGAGTSMAVGLPGIDKLSDIVVEQLGDTHKEQYQRVRAELAQSNPNVENVLDRIRTYRDLMGDSEELEFAGLKGTTATRELDAAICHAICDTVRLAPPEGLGPYLVFAQWVRALHVNRGWPVEVFTTNYDLLAEQALEDSGVPFFDGFVGSAYPFFAPESVDAELGREEDAMCPPRGWTRAWKLHGSVNWRVQRDGPRQRITRVSGSRPEAGDELIIFPSREKYAESRRLPFLAFHDRFRRFLSSGECLLAVIGYSFSDEHVNEVIFQGLRSNPRASAMTLAYGQTCGDGEAEPRTLPEALIVYATQNRNLAVYGPDRACVGGILAPWGEPSQKPKAYNTWPFWDSATEQFTLGDFNAFARFLELFIGFGSRPQSRQETVPGNADDQLQQEVPER